LSGVCLSGVCLSGVCHGTIFFDNVKSFLNVGGNFMVSKLRKFLVFFIAESAKVKKIVIKV